MMDPLKVARMVELGEGGAYASWFAAAPDELNVKTMRFGGAYVLIAPCFDIILLNRVIGLGLTEPATESMIDALLARFQQAGVRNFAFQISPAAQPWQLVDWLTARGLGTRGNWSKCYRAVEPAVTISTDLQVAQIGPEHAGALATVACTAFEMPETMEPWLEASVGRAGWRHYLAFDGDKPVATGALFVQGEIGWLGMGSTLPSQRRRGAQGAIMAQRIRDAREMGCRWVISETGEDLPIRPNPSYRNMVRTGFKLAYQRPNYMLSAG